MCPLRRCEMGSMNKLSGQRIYLLPVDDLLSIFLYLIVSTEKPLQWRPWGAWINIKQRYHSQWRPRGAQIETGSIALYLSEALDSTGRPAQWRPWRAQRHRLSEGPGEHSETGSVKALESTVRPSQWRPWRAQGDRLSEGPGEYGSQCSRRWSMFFITKFCCCGAQTKIFF